MARRHAAISFCLLLGAAAAFAEDSSSPYQISDPNASPDTRRLYNQAVLHVLMNLNPADEGNWPALAKRMNGSPKDPAVRAQLQAEAQAISFLREQGREVRPLSDPREVSALQQAVRQGGDLTAVVNEYWPKAMQGQGRQPGGARDPKDTGSSLSDRLRSPPGETEKSGEKSGEQDTSKTAASPQPDQGPGGEFTQQDFGSTGSEAPSQDQGPGAAGRGGSPTGGPGGALAAGPTGSKGGAGGPAAGADDPRIVYAQATGGSGPARFGQSQAAAALRGKDVFGPSREDNLGGVPSGSRGEAGKAIPGGLKARWSWSAAGAGGAGDGAGNSSWSYGITGEGDPQGAPSGRRRGGFLPGAAAGSATRQASGGSAQTTAASTSGQSTRASSLAAPGKAPAAAGSEEQLSSEELRELAQVRAVLKDAAEKGMLDTAALVQELERAVQAGGGSLKMNDVLERLKAVLPLAGAPLTMAQRQEVLALAARLGLSEAQAFALIKAIERSQPPAPSQRRLMRWERFLLWLKSLLAALWRWLQSLFTGRPG